MDLQTKRKLYVKYQYMPNIPCDYCDFISSPGMGLTDHRSYNYIKDVYNDMRKLIRQKYTIDLLNHPDKEEEIKMDLMKMMEFICNNRYHCALCQTYSARKICCRRLTDYA